MAKQIVYLITDNGIEGKSKTSILSAFLSEEERNIALEKDTAKAWRSTEEKIVDLEVAKAQALAKLNGIDRFVLGLPTWHSQHYKQ